MNEGEELNKTGALLAPSNVECICRLCATTSDKTIHIYGEEAGSDLATKINQFLPIQVNQQDTHLQCCLTCYSTLEAYSLLYITCLDVDRRLKDVQVEEIKGFEDEEISIQCTEESDEETEDNPEYILPTTSKEPTNSETSNNIELEDDVSLNCFTNASLTTAPSDSTEIKEEERSNDWTVKNEHSDDCHYICEHCNESFDTELAILDHMKEKHLASQNRRIVNSKHTKLDQDAIKNAKLTVGGKVYYNCKECGKNLHSPYTFVWHMRIHTGERPYVCDLCGKQFRVSQGLVRHLKETHEGIKNFPCDLCGRMFATRRNVVEHRRIHTNERPYICDLCGKSFKQKASLYVHNRSHTDSFPHRCGYCNQGFRTKPPLLIHITRHTGEKPYPCEICGRCFRIKYELKRHMLIHSDEKPFVCSVCGVTFRQKRYLRNHARINHNNTEPI